MQFSSSWEFLKRIFHPRIFGKWVMERIPYSAQEVEMKCPHPKKVNVMGRQIGKSSVLIGDDACRVATLLPHISALREGESKPLPFLALLIGSVKEQAFELQNAIRDSFDRHEWLRKQLSLDATKTNIKLKDGQRILVRPATKSARGLGAQTVTRNGRVLKGVIRVYLDEAWIMKPGFIRSVIEPMFLAGGWGSMLTLCSTPYGESGDMWDLYDAKTTGDCLQAYELDGEGRRQYTFDRELCKLCMKKNAAVRFNFASTENPYANERQLYDTKVALVNSGREEVWTQEYRGKPVSTAGLFFNEYHQELFFDDNLPLYRLSAQGRLVKLDADEEGAFEDPVQLKDFSRWAQGQEIYLGIDNNSGVKTKQADFAAIAAGWLRPDKKAQLLLCERFRKALPFLDDGAGGQVFDESKPHELTNFMLALAIFLIETLRPRKVYIDQGFGQALYVPLVNRFGESLLEYIPTSDEQKHRCMVHVRRMIETGNFTSPAIQFLREEMKYLKVVADSLEQDKVKVEKAAAWGSVGKQVDGLFAIGYMMRGTERELGGASLQVSQQMDLTRVVGRPRLILQPTRRMVQAYGRSN